MEMLPPLRLHEVLRCPDDGGRLAASLACTACGRLFERRDGILSLLPSGPVGAEDGDVAAEREQRDREAAVYDHLPGLRLLSPFEIPLTLGPLRVAAGERLVEVGAGTGRLGLSALRSGAAAIMVDHSLESLARLRKKLDAAGQNALLLQADARRLPLAGGWATRLLSAQMLEHLPGPSARGAAVSEMARVLAPGGRIALTAYWHTPGFRWLLKREGKHSGAIYFHRFDRPELRALLEPHFRLERVTGRLLYVLLAHGTRR